MQEVGNLSIDDNSKESKLDDTLLAIEGSQDPFGDATAFLEGKGFSDGETAKITGDSGKVGDVDVIFMTNAERVTAAKAVQRRTKTRPNPPARVPVTPVKKKALVKAPAKRVVKKAAKKASAKKSRGKRR